MSLPAPKTESPSHVSVTTRRLRTTMFTFGSSLKASGPISRAFIIAMSTSRGIPKTVWRRRSTSRSRRSELTWPNKKAVEFTTAFLLGEAKPVLLLGKGRDCACLVVLDVEDSVEFRDLQQIVHLLGQVQQLQLAAAVLHCREGADQFADAGAVDIADVAQVQQNLVRTLRQYITYSITNRYATFAESNTAAEIQYGNAVHLASLYFHAHLSSSP